MKTELITESLKLEGELFKIGRRLDKYQNLNEYVKLRKDHDLKTIKYTQYRMVLDEIEKQEAMAKIKRRMMR